MKELSAVLQLASLAMPAIGGTVAAIMDATAETDPAPLTKPEADGLLSALTTAGETLPVLVPIVPLVARAFAGAPFNDADLATLRDAADHLDASVAAAAASVTAGGAGTGDAPA